MFFGSHDLISMAGEPELGSTELGFFEGAGGGAKALLSDVSGAGAIKFFGCFNSYPIIEKM